MSFCGQIKHNFTKNDQMLIYVQQQDLMNQPEEINDTSSRRQLCAVDSRLEAINNNHIIALQYDTHWGENTYN
jgi:hypothetical protein